MEDPNRQFKRLSSVVRGYLDDQSCDWINQAYRFAFQAYEGQLRDSGGPYIIHPLATAEYLAKMQMDTAMIVAALLHD